MAFPGPTADLIATDEGSVKGVEQRVRYLAFAKLAGCEADRRVPTSKGVPSRGGQEPLDPPFP